MKLAKWDDGYVFDVDPRREDPLYYYMREGGWGSAIGIEVGPLYEEHTAARVTIRIWPEHLPREAGLDPADKTWHPTPVGRQFCFPLRLARRGCTLRWAKSLSVCVYS